MGLTIPDPGRTMAGVSCFRRMGCEDSAIGVAPGGTLAVLSTGNAIGPALHSEHPPRCSAPDERSCSDLLCDGGVAVIARLGRQPRPSRKKREARGSHQLRGTKHRTGFPYRADSAFICGVCSPIRAE